MDILFLIVFICVCYYGLEHKYKNTSIDFLIRDYLYFIFVKNLVPGILLVLTGILVTEQCVCNNIAESIFSGVLVSFLTYGLFQGYDYHQKRQKWKEVTSVIVWNIINCSLLYLYNLTFQGYIAVASLQLKEKMQIYESAFAELKNRIIKFQFSGIHCNDLQQIINFEMEMLNVLRNIQTIEKYQSINRYSFIDFMDTVESLVGRLELIFHQTIFYISDDNNKFIEGFSQWIEALQYLRGNKEKILLQPTNVTKIVHDTDIISKNRIVLEKALKFVVL